MTPNNILKLLVKLLFVSLSEESWKMLCVSGSLAIIQAIKTLQRNHCEKKCNCNYTTNQWKPRRELTGGNNCGHKSPI